MDARKILQDLQYRVSTRRAFEKLTTNERAMISQFFRKQFDWEAAAALDDIVFPTNHLKCDPKQLPRQI